MSISMDNGVLSRGFDYIKNTLEPSTTDEHIEIDQDKRNTLIKTGAATTSLVGLAGCAGQSPQPGTSTTQNRGGNSTQKTEEPEETDEGLQLGFTEQDMWEKETEYFERRANASYGDVTPHELAVEYAEQHGLYDLDFKDQEEVEDTISAVTYGTVTSLGERTEGASSSSIFDAAAAINIELNKALEGTEYRAKLIPEIENGHGSAYFASTELPLLTVDSNTRNVGTVNEEPLQDREINAVNDPLADFDDKDFDEIDERERSTYHNFPARIYSKGTESSRHIGFESDIIDDVYDEAIFSDNKQLWFGPVKQAVGTIRALLDEGIVEEYGLTISSGPSKLPTADEYENFDQYANDLFENHVQTHETRNKLIKAALEP